MLRPFRAEDVDDVLAYRDDPEFARLLQKLGMQYVTIRRGDHVGRNGVLVDDVVYELSLTPGHDADALEALGAQVRRFHSTVVEELRGS